MHTHAHTPARTNTLQVPRAGRKCEGDGGRTRLRGIVCVCVCACARACVCVCVTYRVAAGECHSIVLSTAGQVYTWGQGTFGALGHGNEDNCHAPTHVQSLWPMGIVQVGSLRMLKQHMQVTWDCLLYLCVLGLALCLRTRVCSCLCECVCVCVCVCVRSPVVSITAQP